MELVKECLGKVAITIEKDYWRINKAYDRLVVVEVANQYKTYISRKPVPAGTFITDREYWIPFSSLTEEITNNYNALFTKVESIEEWYDQLNRNVNIANAAIIVLKESTNDLRSAYKAIDEYIKTISSTGVGESNMTFDDVLNIPKWLDSKSKYVDSIGRDVTTYEFAEEIGQGHTSRVYEPTYYKGYTILTPGGIEVWVNPSDRDAGWTTRAFISPEDYPTFVVESDMGIYKRNNTDTGWTKIGEF